MGILFHDKYDHVLGLIGYILYIIRRIFDQYLKDRCLIFRTRILFVYFKCASLVNMCIV
jgi:hypothetical protein